MRLERFMREVKEEFEEVKEVDSIRELEKFLKTTYRKAKDEGDKVLYTKALHAYNRLLYINDEI